MERSWSLIIIASQSYMLCLLSLPYSQPKAAFCVSCGGEEIFNTYLSIYLCYKTTTPKEEKCKRLAELKTGRVRFFDDNCYP